MAFSWSADTKSPPGPAAGSGKQVPGLAGQDGEAPVPTQSVCRPGRVPDRPGHAGAKKRRGPVADPRFVQPLAVTPPSWALPPSLVETGRATSLSWSRHPRLGPGPSASR